MHLTASNVFKMLQEVRPSTLKMNGKMESLIKEIEDIKRNQMEILELKNITNIRNCMEMTESVQLKLNQQKLEIIQPEQPEENRFWKMKNNDDRGSSARRYKKEERRVCAEKVFKEIMAPNFPNLVKGINTQIQEARGTSNRMRPKKSMPRLPKSNC